MSSKWFDRIVVTYLENTNCGKALKNSPFFLLNKPPFHATLLRDYHGVKHPSQPNYFALMCGDTPVEKDEVEDVDGRCIVDLLEQKGVTWGSYCEGYPDNWADKVPKLDHQFGRYVRRHNPLVSMKSVQSNPLRAANDNNAHDTNTEYAAAYIRDFYLPMTSHPFFTSQRTLFVLTFDESANYIAGNNHVATWLFGTAVKSTPAGFNGGMPYKDCGWEWAIEGMEKGPEHAAVALKPNYYWANLMNLLGVVWPVEEAEFDDGGVVGDGRFDHYDVLKTVEDNWGLGNLGRNDTNATGFAAFLKE
ncbi:hypothetical protein HDU83_008684 [Entophlyctis luteolus]|nr:hypothetical protein HDU83_008684 [Entophlyctis luteolus]